jgi:hypothetical protein
MIIADISVNRGEVLMLANEFQKMKEYRPEDVPASREVGLQWVVDLNFDIQDATEHNWYMGEFVVNSEDENLLDICWRKINLINVLVETVSIDNIGGV